MYPDSANLVAPQRINNPEVVISDYPDTIKVFTGSSRDQVQLDYDLPIEYGDAIRKRAEFEMTFCLSLYGFTHPQCTFNPKVPPSIEFEADPADFGIHFGPQTLRWEHNDRVTSFIIKALMYKIRDDFKSMPKLKIRFIIVRPTLDIPAVVWSSFSVLFAYSGLWNRRLANEMVDARGKIVGV